ncbi:hypothetical protein DTO271G3_6017 [Paecilomyces variotii]|nr:hypothetical protein DTO271G3_6017 [Paecilomyces variotii]
MMTMAKPPSPPPFLYVPSSSMASRRDIEQSSYSTTPALSQGARTPPSGQVTYLPEEELATINDALRAKLFKDKIHAGLERVVLLEANDETAKEINVEQSGGGGIYAEIRDDTHPYSYRGRSQGNIEAEADGKKPDIKEQLKGSKQ